MSSSTKYRRTDPDNTIMFKSAALMCRLGEIMSDLDLDNHINMISCGPLITKFMTRVILVGSNPSQKSPDNTAFHPSTKSRQFVNNWFEGQAGIDVDYMNLINKKTEKNKQLTKTQIKNELENIQLKFKPYISDSKIIACGKIAAMGLTMAGIEHFEMPHPSGLCRFWNDSKASEEKVKEMLEWVRN